MNLSVCTNTGKERAINYTPSGHSQRTSFPSSQIYTGRSFFPPLYNEMRNMLEADLRLGEHIRKMQNDIGRKSTLPVLRQPRSKEGRRVLAALPCRAMPCGARPRHECPQAPLSHRERKSTAVWDQVPARVPHGTYEVQ